jgi:hypothetical protein
MHTLLAQVHHLPAVAEADVEDGSLDELAHAPSGLSSLRSRAVSVRASGTMSVVNRYGKGRVQRVRHLCAAAGDWRGGSQRPCLCWGCPQLCDRTNST